MAASTETRAAEDHDRIQHELLNSACNPSADYPLADLITEMDDPTLDAAEAFWRGQLGAQNVAVLAVSIIERERLHRAQGWCLTNFIENSVREG